MSLLTVGNPKTQKGESLGYLTGVLHFLPADTGGLRTQSGAVFNACQFASAGCSHVETGCLAYQGRGIFSSVREARRRRLAAFLKDREAFEAALLSDIDRLARSAERKGMKPVFRVNGTSDMPGLAKRIAQARPHLRFYDYTKVPAPQKRTLPNYHLTFSRSETNEKECVDALLNGINVAVVFRVKRGRPLPTSYMGRPVIDGDVHDLRFLDASAPDGFGVIVGLRAKGRASRDATGFVVDVEA